MLSDFGLMNKSLKEFKDFQRILFTPSEIDSGFGVFDFGVNLIFVKPQNPGLSDIQNAILKGTKVNHFESTF